MGCCRKIAIALIDSAKGEWKAQSCAMAGLQQFCGDPNTMGESENQAACRATSGSSSAEGGPPKDLNKKAFGGLLFLLLVMAALLFLPAWRLSYWQAWAFLAVFGASALVITLYLMKKDPKLLERRVYAGPTAEKETNQKIIQTIASTGFAAILVVSAFDNRYAWTPLSLYVSLAGDALVALGFLIIFFVYKENTFASATIEIAPEQKVISTGLYKLVRHPMYMGAFSLLVGIPLSLGSGWGLVVIALMMPALIWRLLDEEKFLAKNLPGYTEYQNAVRYRLVPRIW
jgi:protein-S-isoprenylcysteine O-methyltransferase Ste14